MGSAKNGTPLLSRPQHEYFRTANYLEIDVNMHLFCYAARSAMRLLLDDAPTVLRFGWVLQGDIPEELPEQILASALAVRFTVPERAVAFVVDGVDILDAHNSRRRGHHHHHHQDESPEHKDSFPSSPCSGPASRDN